MVAGSKGTEQSVRLVYGNAPGFEEPFAYTRLISANFNPVTSIPTLPQQALARVVSPTLLVAGKRM